MEATAESHDLARRILAQSSEIDSPHTAASIAARARARPSAYIRRALRSALLATGSGRRRGAKPVRWAGRQPGGSWGGGSATPAAEAEVSAAHGPIGDMAKRVRGG